MQVCVCAGVCAGVCLCVRVCACVCVTVCLIDCVYMPLCAGCPRQIGLSLAKARLCDFSGQYYCESCHHGDLSIIPSRMVHNWDLTPRQVSQGSLRVCDVDSCMCIHTVCVCVCMLTWIMCRCVCVLTWILCRCVCVCVC